MLSPWLSAHLETVQGYNRLYRPVARAGRCGICRAYVLRGLDGDPMGCPAKVDVEALSLPRDEVLALRQGRHTYRLIGSTPQTMAIAYRGVHEIMTQPVGWADRMGAVTVVVTHRCYVPVERM